MSGFLGGRLIEAADDAADVAAVDAEVITDAGVEARDLAARNRAGMPAAKALENGVHCLVSTWDDPVER